MRVIVCGDREWRDGATIAYAMRGLPKGTVIVHGACRGADTLAPWEGHQRGFAGEPHPYKSELGKAGGPVRNAEMAKAGADLCLAFHDNIDLSRGTKDMVTKAIAAGIPTIIIRAVSTEGPEMNCTDYRRCEARDCRHRVTPRYRWRAADGCSGQACIECLKPTDDIVELSEIDRNGIPVDSRARTLADVLANAFLVRGAVSVGETTPE